MVKKFEVTRRAFLFGSAKVGIAAAFLPVIGGPGPLMAAREFDAVPGPAMYHGEWVSPTMVAIMTDMFRATGMESDEFDVNMFSGTISGMFVPGPFRLQVRSRKIEGTPTVTGADVWGQFAGVPPDRDEVVRVWLPHDDGHATVGDFKFRSLPEWEADEVEKLPASTRRPEVLGGVRYGGEPTRRGGGRVLRGYPPRWEGT